MSIQTSPHLARDYILIFHCRFETTISTYILSIRKMQTSVNLVIKLTHTLPFKMFGPFGSVWCKIALGEVGVSLP